MERNIRLIFNFTFIVPLLISWGLLIKNNYFHKALSISSIANSNDILDSKLKVANRLENRIKIENNVKDKSVMNNPIKKAEVISSEALNENNVVSEEVPSENSSKIDNFDLELQRVQSQVRQLALFEKSKADLVNKLEDKNIESQELNIQDSAPDYDETLVELSEYINNERPLISKYINTVFSRNIMRSFREDGHKVIAFKGEALLANGPRGTVVSKNNLKFLEASFSRFKTRFGLSKVIVSVPEGYNTAYAKRINKFAKNYFNNDLEVVTDHEGAEGLEIILVGVRL